MLYVTTTIIYCHSWESLTSWVYPYFCWPPQVALSWMTALHRKPMNPCGFCRQQQNEWKGGVLLDRSSASSPLSTNEACVPRPDDQGDVDAEAWNFTNAIAASSLQNSSKTITPSSKVMWSTLKKKKNNKLSWRNIFCSNTPKNKYVILNLFWKWYSIDILIFIAWMAACIAPKAVCTF